MIGCRVLNSICEPGGIVGPLFLSLPRGRKSTFGECWAFPLFACPCPPPVPCCAGWGLFFSQFSHSSIAFAAAAASLADADVRIHMRTTWSFWPNSEPLRSDTTLEVTLWELISSKIGLRGPDDGSPVTGKVNWHAGIPEQIGILDYFLTAFTGLSPHPNQHHAVP
ncbi:hypothetical protein CMEL01_10459 [Colletotrichum melonis]|uniref:Uncharacterized protein n=1 Tax=Colletotrichum melonis TaxID=1209925 RepID=A0AAI9TUV3_9PEZI|nr:hypothetical protein CMEL01_10459 [Colletotrichum melonis]